MATLTVKNVPERLHKRLKESAALHRRSMNSEILACLEQILPARRMEPKKFLVEVRALRGPMPGTGITDEFLRYAKNEGRL